jgi:ankyrin repeat protein
MCDNEILPLYGLFNHDPADKHIFVTRDAFLRADEHGRTSLHYLCMGDITEANCKAIESILELGANPNHNDCLGDTPLSCLLRCRYTRQVVSCVITLLKYGADPNDHDPSELSPLMLAVLQGSYIVVRNLVKYGANLKYSLKREDICLVPNNSTALTIATALQDKLITKYLTRMESKLSA